MGRIRQRFVLHLHPIDAILTVGPEEFIFDIDEDIYPLGLFNNLDEEDGVFYITTDETVYADGTMGLWIMGNSMDQAITSSCLGLNWIDKTEYGP